MLIRKRWHDNIYIYIYVYFRLVNSPLLLGRNLARSRSRFANHGRHRFTVYGWWHVRRTPPVISLESAFLVSVGKQLQFLINNNR